MLPGVHGMNEDFELFVFAGRCRPSGNMQKSDPHFPPNTTLERGADSIRSYWNAKSKREGERRVNK